MINISDIVKTQEKSDGSCSMWCIYASVNYAFIGSENDLSDRH